MPMAPSTHMGSSIRNRICSSNMSQTAVDHDMCVVGNHAVRGLEMGARPQPYSFIPGIMRVSERDLKGI